MRHTQVPDGELDERGFQTQIMDTARLFGWRRAHFRAARTVHGWKTPVAGDGKGFPDLCLVRERILFAELKTQRGKLTTEQSEWIAALASAGVEVHVWRPEDFDEITRILREHRPTATVAA